MRRRALWVLVSMLGSLAVLPAVHAHAAGVNIALSPNFGPPTTKVKVTGAGFPASDPITVTFDTATVASATTNGAGKFSVSFNIPATAPPGAQTVAAFDVAGLGGSAAFLVRTDWNSVRFDPASSGFNPYENVLSPTNAGDLSQLADTFWGSSQHSAPIYAGGNLYAGSSDDTVRAFDGVGRQIWSFSTGGAVVGSPLAVVQHDLASPGPIQDCAIVAGSQDGHVYGLDPSTGTQLWSFNAGAPVSTSPIDPTAVETIYVTANNGSVFALNGCTGAPAWSDVEVNPGPPQTPAVLGSVKLSDGTTRTIIVVCFGGGSIDALDASTGALLWTHVAAGPGPIQAPSAYGSGKNARIVFGLGASVVELSASTGNQIWSFATGAPVGGGIGLDDVVAAGGPVAGPDLKLSLHAIIAGDANGDLYALNPKSGKQLWSENNPGPVQTPTIANGVVYVLCGPGPIQAGAFEARNVSDGSLLFSADLGSKDPGPLQSPAVANGDVFTEDNSGDLLIFGLVGTV